MPGNGVNLDANPVIGCECTDCYKERNTCCGCNAGSAFAYYIKKRVRLPPGYPIYECNIRCRCGPECSNRVVQNGRKHRVCIFRTNNGRGWGVKAMQKIKKGSFVMEYVGEVSVSGANHDLVLELLVSVVSFFVVCLKCFF
jgi:histone-lysine N-methyltransferase SUV39H